ncbi:MAG: N-formylglutamate amidohydrolase [Rhodospirillales bacterium]|nr:N-formylglutamate amidohydrolase [Rhodospirillales bacterium]
MAATSSSSSDRPALLASGEAPPVEFYNRAGTTPLLLLCDHASRRVPRALGRLGLPVDAFDRHVAWDIGAADLAHVLADEFDAPLVLSGYSRLVIDLNRRLDDPTSIPETSDDIDIPGNRGLSAAARAARVHALFDPYHAAVAAALAAFKARGAVPAVISVHSCTPVFKGFERPWHVGVLWNEDGRLALPLIERLAAMSGIVVGDNQPYSGRDFHGFTTKHHAEAAGLAHATLEIRQDLIDTRHGAAEWAEVVARALRPLLADATLCRYPIH